MAVETLSKEALESKYRLLLSWRNSTVDFLGLPSFQDDQPVSLESIYVGTRLTWEPEGKSRLYLANALKQHRRLVVLGDPGSGKSTLVKVITYSFGRTEPTPLARMLGPVIPVPIPITLRDYKVREWGEPADMLRDFIAQLDPEIREHVNPEWLLEILRSGRAALLLDGLDEVGSLEDRCHLRDRVVVPLLSGSGDSIVVLTSRIAGYDEAPFDGGQPQGPSRLRRCYIAPFGDDEIREYVRRWYSLRESRTDRCQDGIDSLAGAILQNRRIRELAEKPDLLALMTLIHRVTGALPLDRLKLYDKIVEAYLETLQVYRKLPRFQASLEEMKRWLGVVGWEMQSRWAGAGSQLSASRSEVVDWLCQALAPEDGGSSQIAEAFLDYTTRRAGLVVLRGPQRVSFAHLSFQEYFAAWHLRGKIRRFDELVALCVVLLEVVQWHEALVLLFGMLAEFPGAADDLAHEIAERTRDSPARPAAASLFIQLLAIETGGRFARRGHEQPTSSFPRGPRGNYAILEIFAPSSRDFPANSRSGPENG